MTQIFLVLLWVHLLALAMGGAASFGIPVVGAAMGGASPEARPTLAAIAERLSKLGRVAIGLLILTGIGMVYLGPGIGIMGLWFWLKMAAVIALIAGIIIGVRTGKRAQAGDAAAQALAPRIGMVNLMVLALIIAFAVLEFH